jgi:hypothetical protein
MLTITNPYLANKIEVHQVGLDYHLIYLTEDIESIDRQTLTKLSFDLGCLGETTLYTNAGVDLHSSEEARSITIRKMAPGFYDYLLKVLEKKRLELA